MSHSEIVSFLWGVADLIRDTFKLEKFDFDNTISKLEEAGLIFKVIERFENDPRPCLVTDPARELDRLYSRLVVD